MRRNSLWLIVVVLLVVVILLATDTLEISCDSNKLDVPGALENAGEDIKDAAEELTGN